MAWNYTFCIFFTVFLNILELEITCEIENLTDLKCPREKQYFDFCSERKQPNESFLFLHALVILILDLYRRWTENSWEVTGRLVRLPQTEMRDCGTDCARRHSCVGATVSLIFMGNVFA